ncbi:MAG: hypothetical protein L0Y44_00645 [Phycisphaerales bacterium]|nr:hypothetical protein [Phycisphaerales bacterium]MCI0676717.1 hypothetical protein [Phycisphaerales bacterium]
MNEIRALLKIAARRLELNSFIGKLHATAIAFSAVALATMFVDRATGSFVPWRWIGPALLALALLVAVILWARRRMTDAHVALVVDERLDLREKISTALHCQGRDDPFAQAAIEDAVLTARDGRTREQVRRRFGLTAPNGWWISPLIVLLAIIASFLPSNLLTRDPNQDPAVTKAKLEADQTIEAMVKAIQEKPELSKELGLGELTNEGADPNAPIKPEDHKRNALRVGTEINKKLDEILNGEKGKTAETLEKSLGQLKTPESGPAKELAEAMARGDFKGAQEALKELMEKAEKGQLNQEDKEKLAEQLKDIAEQLDKLAQQQQQLENALKQAGMDPNLAQNPQALQQAIQNNQNLNQQQKQQLQQMAQAQQAACQMCQGLGQACQNMAQGMNQGAGQGQMAQAAGQMGQQLGQMEQLQQLLQQAQAAANQCQGQCNGIGQGLNMQQALAQWKKQGGGMGNWGQGAGGNAPIAPTPSATKMEKANIKTVEGDIIAKQLFEGQQIRGDSKVKLVKVIEEARKGFDEGLTEDQLHIKYREAMMHYFGELEKLTQATSADQKPAEPKPAEPAKP